ncbi:hypothetical protein FRB93_011556 [Tulasnella sp. JGI-2019a]|nr:hypothetical protein FRB93_011556 [Tulasnella sp. JGI-2019a]
MMDVNGEGSMNAPADLDLDAEKIHNMINMSMTHAHDLVSSWMFPHTNNPKAPLPSLDDREFQKLVMRPPRLGIGAIEPATSSVASNKDTNKLRYKLTGQKRGREDIGGSTSNTKGKGKAESGSSDEEESRGSVFKKPKLNGIGAFQKDSRMNGTPKKLNPTPAPDVKGKRRVDVDGDDECSDATVDEGAEEWNGLSSSACMDPISLPDVPNGIASSSKPVSLSKELTFYSAGSLLGRLQPTAPVSAMNHTPLTTPNATISPPSSVASSQQVNGLLSPTLSSGHNSYAPNGHPLSPAINGDGNSEEPRKKRRKKKKKNKSTAHLAQF